MRCGLKPYFKIEQVDEFGIVRKTKGVAEKYKNRAYKCDLCGWAYSNKSHEKVDEHETDCPAIWIYEDWEPQTLQDLKFVKS